MFVANMSRSAKQHKKLQRRINGKNINSKQVKTAVALSKTEDPGSIRPLQMPICEHYGCHL